VGYELAVRRQSPPLPPPVDVMPSDTDVAARRTRPPLPQVDARRPSPQPPPLPATAAAAPCRRRRGGPGIRCSHGERLVLRRRCRSSPRRAARDARAPVAACSRAWRLALGHPPTHRAAARRLRLRGARGACGRTPPALGVHAPGAALHLQLPQRILRRHRDDRCRRGRHDSLRLCGVQAVREARGRQRRRRARWTAKVMVLAGARRAAAAG